MSSLAWAVFTSWSVPFWATLTVLSVAVFYVRGWRSLNQLRSTLLPGWRLICFIAGLAAFWLALASPLDAFGNFLLTAHMIQHMLIMFVAPPLILLGSPQNPLFRGLPRWAIRDVAGPFLTWPLLKRFGRAVTHPAFCWFAAALALLAWHIPAAYDLALTSPGWHEVEHACLFGTSLLFWWPVVQPWPGIPRWPRWTIPVYLLFGDLVTTALSGVLCFSDRLLYPPYASVPRFFGISALDDQAMAGAIMWVFGSLILLGAAIATTVRLLEPSRTIRQASVQRLSRRPAASRARSPFDLLRTPIVGSLLRARYGRRTLQAILLTVTVAVIADGFSGHPMAPMNLAGVIPWTYGRVLVVVGLLTAGNFFCMACPFTLPRELGRRLGFATRSWPRGLRSKWFAVILLILFFWAYEVFDIWDSPHLTAWLLVGYFAAAFVVDTFFRGASFCKYVCPIGQFNFLSSLVSPLEVRVRSRDACASCATQDCVRGNASQRGCELQLFLPRKVGNMDCTLCLDCVKACPHDNIGILAIASGRDLVKDRPRSSLGRFSRRLDIAVVALVLVFSAFVSAAAMVGPVASLRNRLAERYSMGSTLPIDSLFFLAGLVLAPPILVGAAVHAGRALAHIGASVRELFCRFALALVPLGLAMWAAHLLFHFSTAWSTPWPVIQRAMGDLGVDWLGAPRWAPSNPLFAPGVTLGVQLLLLDAGLLLSLYAGWRVAREYTNRVLDGLLLLTPWATAAAMLYAAGFWVFLQPMQMRGMIHG
jgi:cytochrome c oxidase assembly factor CtaG